MAARSSITNLTILRELEAEIEKDCDALRSFLMAIQVGILSFDGTPSFTFRQGHLRDVSKIKRYGSRVR